MAVKKSDVGIQKPNERLDRRIWERTKELNKLTSEQADVSDLEDVVGLSTASEKACGIREMENRIDRLIRLKEVLEIVPISKSTWWAGVKTGRYPQPVHHLGPRITAWSMAAIMQLVNGSLINDKQ